MITLRDYQTEHVNKVLRLYKINMAVSLSAYTGFGKTITSLYIANKIGAKSVLIVVPTKQLKSQWSEVVLQFPELDTTVELIHNVHKLEKIYDFFVFDEAHMYGLENNKDEVKMFESFISEPKHKNTKRLVLTATNSGVDRLFSGKGVAEVKIGLDKGIECGALHDVQLRVITNGLEVLADKLAGVKSHKSFEELAKTIEENNINIASEESKKVLMDCYATNLVALVNAEHLDKKVLVYTKSIEECEELARRYEQKALRKTLVLHSKIKDSKAVLEKFKTSNEHNIIFNVNILTAGFDFDGAEVVFDFAFSQSNESRILIQRLGRIARYKKDKAPIYYVMLTYSNGFRLERVAPKKIVLSNSAGDITRDELNNRNLEKDHKDKSLTTSESADRTEGSKKDSDIELKKDVAESAAREVAIEATANIQAEKSVADMSREEMENTTITEPQTEASVINGVVEGEKIPIVVGTWHLKFAGGKSEARRVKISELVKWDEGRVDQNKKELLEMAKAGRPKPRWNSRFGRLLSHYTSETDNSYDHSFTIEIRNFWPLRSALVSDAKSHLLKMAISGEAPPQGKSQLGIKLSSYTSPSSGCYDEVFTQKIREIWQTNSAKKQEKKSLLLKMAEAGEPRPHKNTPLGQALNSYMKRDQKDEDPHFYHRIRELWPLGDSMQEKKALLMKRAEAGEPRPKKGHPLYVCLCFYTNKNTKSYDPDFHSRISKIWPREDVVSQNKERLLELATQGQPRPSQATRDGRLLANYLRTDESFRNEIGKFWPTKATQKQYKK